MAEVYRTVNGRQIEKFLATMPGVQATLDEKAGGMADVASALLAEHRDEGDARIVVESGNVDRYVMLDDTRGLLAALSIEYGRKPNDEGKGGMKGLFILHRAAQAVGG